MDTTESGQGPVVGPCECGYEPSGSIKGREFTDNSTTVSFSRKSPA
jgi:hypothetical protein